MPSEILSREDRCLQFKNNLPTDEGYVQGYIKTNIYGIQNGIEAYDQDELIDVFYYGYISEDKSQVPIVFFNGGPASSSHSSWENLYKDIVADTKQTYIMIDQRGTGCSTAYPDSSYFDLLIDFRTYRYFSSRFIIRDAELVRTKLFGENSKWKIFGQS
ncbi:MAG: alpha/beta fold hydrolase [Oligoflexales bacterium]|nr:alpha/beta fold hydrolase [Oligoflexales bacterium]